jgi:hypothetical protein
MDKTPYHDLCVFEWHKRFPEGREDVEADERPDRPVTKITAETEIVCAKCSQRIRQFLVSKKYQRSGTPCIHQIVSHVTCFFI